LKSFLKLVTFQSPLFRRYLADTYVLVYRNYWNNFNETVCSEQTLAKLTYLNT